MNNFLLSKPYSPFAQSAINFAGIASNWQWNRLICYIMIYSPIASSEVLRRRDRTIIELLNICCQIEALPTNSGTVQRANSFPHICNVIITLTLISLPGNLLEHEWLFDKWHHLDIDRDSKEKKSRLVLGRNDRRMSSLNTNKHDKWQDNIRRAQLRGHNWMLSAHRPQCTVTLNSN